MPNHVVNEVIFRGITPEQSARLKQGLLNEKGNIDFEILVPPPINIWWGNTGKEHTDTFKDSHLDWARRNWGTKWNAYGQRPLEESDDTLKLTFDTAWRPPYNWLVAIFNHFNISFEHNWLSEGDNQGRHAFFNFAETEKDFGDPWKETIAEPDLQKHLHKLRWGVESFDDEKNA